MKRFSFSPFLVGLVAVSLILLVVHHAWKPASSPVEDRPVPSPPVLSALVRPDNDLLKSFQTQLERSKNSYHSYKKAVETAAELGSTRLGSLLEAEKERRRREELIQIWAIHDPQAALDDLKSWSRDDNTKVRSMERVLETWAKSEPAAAQAWLDEFLAAEDPEQDLFGLFRHLKGGLVRGIAKSHPEAALENYQRLKMSGTRVNIAFEKTEDWQRALDRDRAPGFLLQNWYTNDPQACVDWLETQSPGRLTNALSNIGGDLIRYADDPLDRASDYWDQLIGRRKSRVGTKFIDALAARDPNLAAQWLNEHKDEPELDDARASFAKDIASLDPQSALDWTSSIHDPKERAETENSVFRTWDRLDPESAETYFLSLGWDRERIADFRDR